ncbi:MAG: ArsR family transcriptional regulator [Chloroflexi bacterium]|nr:ArsR family transcriptional regulator [Chloroflexota bacterium]
MQATRQQILDYLRTEGEGSVRDLSSHLGLTSTGVRQHLAVLEREGFVESRELRGRVGRPAHAYSLTRDGEALYPKAYDRLASALLIAARRTLDPQTFAGLIREAAGPLAAPHREALAVLDPAARVAAACEILQAWDLVADWEQADDGCFLLHERTCPYVEVARADRAACVIDVAFISEICGMEAELARCQTRGDAMCTYRMRPAPSSGASGASGR